MKKTDAAASILGLALLGSSAMAALPEFNPSGQGQAFLASLSQAPKVLAGASSQAQAPKTALTSDELQTLFALAKKAYSGLNSTAYGETYYGFLEKSGENRYSKIRFDVAKTPEGTPLLSNIELSVSDSALHSPYAAVVLSSGGLIVAAPEGPDAQALIKQEVAFWMDYAAKKGITPSLPH